MSDPETTQILAAIGALSVDISTVRDDLRGLRVDAMDRMDRMQDGITGIRDDIAVNYGASDAVRRANDNTREELRALTDQVTGMMRLIQRLQSDVRTIKGDA